jgi:hypothetical protein
LSLAQSTSSPRRLIRQNPAATRTSTRRAQWLPVPELTRSADIKLNKRVSLQRCSATISFADEAGAPSRYCLGGRVARLGCCLAVDPVRLCRLDFQHRPTVTFQLTILKVLNGQPDGRASLVDLKRYVAILISSGLDWTARMKRLAARAPRYIRPVTGSPI